MLCRLFISTLLVTIFSQNVNAQATLKGKVTGQQGNILSGVIVYQLNKMGNNTTSDVDGEFTLKIPSDTSIKIITQLSGFIIDTTTVRISKGETKTIRVYLELKIQELGTAIITDNRALETGMVSIDRRIITSITGPGGGIEMALKTLPGVYSNNELSSQYSVRGGNYDENLVYVNDVEIYRPFLVRAGQQEGLSFPNPDMVESLRFSAGGFEA